MSVDTPTRDELREALRPMLPDPKAFEQGVRERIERREARERSERERVVTSSPLLRVAASFLPLPLLGGKALLASAKAGPVGSGYKLMGWLAVPAASVFLVLGAFLFSALQIRKTASDGSGDGATARDALRAWWRKHWWIAVPFCVAVIAAPIWTSSTVMLSVLIVSFFALAVFLTALARVGLATRGAIARAVAPGLLWLALPLGTGLSGGLTGLVDPRLVAAVLMLGGLLLVIVAGSWNPLSPNRAPRVSMGIGFTLFLLMSLPSVLRPATPGTMQRYVESLDQAPFGSATWREWEAAVRYLQDIGTELDLRLPRRLFVEQVLDQEDRPFGIGQGSSQSPYVLSIAMRTGLLRPTDFSRLHDLDRRSESLLDRTKEPHPIFLLEQFDWAVRALAASGALTDADRDWLGARLEVTWQTLHEVKTSRLRSALLISHLRDVVGRRGDQQAQQEDVHAWLLTEHKTAEISVRPHGGFRGREDGPTDEHATWAGVCLMERYGMPEGIDPLSVRASMRPRSSFLGGPRWIPAAARFKLDDLFGPPTITDYLARDPALFASLLLVLLALYATLRAPPSDEAGKPTDPNAT